MKLHTIIDITLYWAKIKVAWVNRSVQREWNGECGDYAILMTGVAIVFRERHIASACVIMLMPRLLRINVTSSEH